MKRNTTKVIVILFFIFVSNTYSQTPSDIIPSDIIPSEAPSSLASFHKELKDVILFIFCQTGQIIAAASGGVKAVCSSLPTDGDLANEVAVFVCKNTGRILDAVSGVFIQFCPNSDKKTDPGMDILKTLNTAMGDLDALGPVMGALDALNPALAILSTSSPATGVLNALDPALAILSTSSPSSSTQAISTAASTTQSASTPAPTTSTQEPTTTTQRITTPAPSCSGDQIDRCNDKCNMRSNFNLTLGGRCSITKHARSNTLNCSCKKVQHCDTYTNSTCEQKCEDRYGPDAEYCRVQEANLPCVCKFYAGNDLFLRVPK